MEERSAFEGTVENKRTMERFARRLGWKTMKKPLPDEFLEPIAETFQMLADPTRLAILRALMAGEKNVGQVVDETGGSQANVSKHLKMLNDGGLVARRKQGLQVFYRLDDPLVEKLCEIVCETLVDSARRKIDKHLAFIGKHKGN